MKLGVLETGKLADHLAADHGQYPQIFANLFGQVSNDVEIVPFEVVHGVFPDSPTECDAWLVTGSKFGVYDDEPWIKPLKQYLREIRDAGRPMVGVCFGHQIMAEAFGGRAEKSTKGWGCGVHAYHFAARPGWLKMDSSDFAMHAMHQDQVTVVPDDATIIASSPFCENAMFAYGNVEQPYAVSIQPHPEFTRSLGEALVRFRRGTHIPESVADTAISTFGARVDGTAFAKSCLYYFESFKSENHQGSASQSG